MTFPSIPNGSQVFIDANIFVYSSASDPKYGAACKQFMERIARREIAGFTSAHVVWDVAHRVMTLEAIAQFGWPVKGIAPRLRQHPSEVQKLTRFRQAVDEVPRIGIHVLPIDFDLVYQATALSQLHGLLTGDALVLAVMQTHGLTHLASNDDDFDRVPGLTRYAPA